MSSEKKYLIVVAGPTGVGKTAIGIQLAKFFKSEILSADSRQFYKETIIGTAKPSSEELNEVPHHFINTLSIHQNYTVGDFEKEAITCINKLFETHQFVFLVGGSGLYINSVLYGIDDFLETDLATRELIKSNYKTYGLEWLQEQLKEKDSDYYNTVDLDNPQRIMRALEVCIQNGKPYSSFLSAHKKKRSFEIIKLLINCPRDLLYEKINTRVDKMIANGLINEAKTLYPHKNLNALNTVGYKELFAHFDGDINLEEAINLIKQKTRNYAKRQLTWFKNQDEYEAFGPLDFEKIKAYLEIILKFKK